jgi:hypothetical protein
MFNGKVSVKGLVIGLLFYLLTSIVVMGIVIHFWLPNGIADREQLVRLADSDKSLLLWQSTLGAVLGVLAGFVATNYAGSNGLKTSMALGVVLMAYGVLGIYLHPGHPTAMQIGKLLSPIPLLTFGGWLRLRFVSPK